MQDDLSELFQGDLDSDQLAALFADLESGAEVEHVQVKALSGPPPHDRQSTLSEARTLVEQREVRAVQIRYRFDQQVWCDTLMVLPNTVRLVRTKLEF